MNNIIRIKIEDRIYAVQRFNPLEGMEYGAAIAAVLSPSLGASIGAAQEKDYAKTAMVALSAALKEPNIAPLLKRALGQCFTPQNESLSDEAVFNQYFMKFPQDMFELGVQAAWVLVKDFFPNRLRTLLDGFQIPSNLSGTTE